jgi:head-tail adaptor
LVPVTLIYAIRSADKKVSEKTVELSAPNNKETTSVKEGMTAGHERGTYEVRVTLRADSDILGNSRGYRHYASFFWAGCIFSVR